MIPGRDLLRMSQGAGFSLEVIKLNTKPCFSIL